jgi:hypothetical protein
MAKESTVDWGAQDWSLRDVDIAEATGVSRERVRQVRKALNKPRSPMWHKHVGTAADAISSMDTARLTPEEISRKAKCSEAYAKQCLGSSGKTFTKPPDGRMVHKYAWDSVTPQQWKSLRDKDVAEMLGISNVAVVTQWRRRKGIVKKRKGVRIERETAR